VVPSRKVMEPVALDGAEAVKVTDWPVVEGFADEVRVIVGVAFVIVTVVAGDVAGLLFASPGVLAVMGSAPTGRFETVMVAVPPTIGAVPITVPPLEKVTGPVTPGGTVSVMVTGVPEVEFVGDAVGGGNTGEFLLTTWVRGADVAAPLFASPL
jgi:hypothetical protein